MKITINLKPGLVFGLRDILEDHAMKVASDLERYASYDDSDLDWRKREYENLKHENEVIDGILTAFYQGLDQCESK